MRKKVLLTTLTGLILFGAEVFWLQERRFRERIDALEVTRVKGLATAVYKSLFSAPPEYFAYDLRLEIEISTAFLPLYRSLPVPDKRWQVETATCRSMMKALGVT